MSAYAVGAVDLAVPELGERERADDATFAAWDAVFTTARDTVNHGVRALNGLGLDLPELPPGTLHELAVEPLVGDCEVIRQSADACHRVGDALAALAESTAAVAAVTAVRWSGLAGSACAARLGVDALALRAAGVVVEQGSWVFDEIADVCERLALSVQRAIVALGRAIERLARTVLTRVLGPAGWAALAAEVALRGLDVVSDIVDDVRLVVSLVEELLTLRESVADWAGAQRDRLDLLAHLPRLMP
ncbi:unannotated protein [freshwater metagenome]|uniref:Unannotated protein n=1 Tax=freshwater metagenome TaxID=449393 RepID=A0A6J6Q6D8_9ZZZZ